MVGAALIVGLLVHMVITFLLLLLIVFTILIITIISRIVGLLDLSWSWLRVVHHRHSASQVTTANRFEWMTLMAMVLMMLMMIMMMMVVIVVITEDEEVLL
mgnify:CR=1 FL=1